MLFDVLFQDLEKSPINIKSLLKRLYSLALHPSAAKRLGAALAFNNIYTIFRHVYNFAVSLAFLILGIIRIAHS